MIRSMVPPHPDHVVTYQVIHGKAYAAFWVRCLFCGEYATALRDLIDHFHQEHGRVL